MPLVLMTNQATLFRQLGAGPFVRANVNVLVALTGDELAAMAQELEPDLVLVEAELPDQDGFAVCRAIKQNPACQGTRALVVLPAVADAALLARAQASGCDGVLGVPLDEVELYEHLAPLLDLPVRRSRRTVVQLRVALRTGAGEIPGEVRNVSSGGACVVARTELEVGTSLILHAGGAGTAIELPARVVWRQSDPDGRFRMGLELATSDPQTEERLVELGLWDLRLGADGTAEVGIYGRISETTSFARLLAELRAHERISFDLGGLEGMSSAGVRSWCNLLASLGAERISLRCCSPAFTIQMSMVPSVIGRASVISVRAPFACPRCEEETERLLDVASIRVGEQIEVPAPGPCAQCGSPLVLDELPERYFAFLRRQ